MIRNSPTMQESWVWSLGWENQYSSEIPWTEEPGGLQPVGPQRVRPDWRTNKELGPTVVRLTDVKSARQDNRLETRAGADTAVWRQNPFFSRNPQEYLRRHSHPSMNFMRKETLRDRLCSDDLSRKSNLGRAFICHLALLRLNSSKTQLFKQFMCFPPSFAWLWCFQSFPQSFLSLLSMSLHPLSILGERGRLEESGVGEMPFP